MKKLISVTEEHIKNGEPSMCRYCPIAWAIGLACKPFLFKEVREDCVVVTETEDRVRLPRSARRFIHRFDSGKSVKPFRFYLDVPE